MADPLMGSLVATMRRELLRFAVQRAIFCPYTGTVLDVRTCAVVLDADGDPLRVMSPAAGEIIRADGPAMSTLRAAGYALVLADERAGAGL